MIHDTLFVIGQGNVSGKTVTAEILMIQYLCKEKTFNYYISPSFSQGRKVYTEITKLLEGKNIIRKANSSTLTIESVYGSTLQFFSFENVTAVRGYTVKNGLVVIDEAAFASSPNEEDPFMSVIYPTIKANFKRNKVLVISTPRGKQGLFFNLWSKALSGEKGFKYMQSSIYDDSLITEDQIEEIKRMMPPQIFAEEFECKFLDSSMTFFQGFENCFHPISKKYNKTWIGIDPSGNGDDNTVITKINENNEVEQFIIKGTFDMKYEKIAEIINTAKNLQYSYCEDNGLGAPFLNSLKKYLKDPHKLQPWTTTNLSKEKILSKLAVKITNKEITFDEANKQLFSELGTFVATYTKKGNMQLAALQGHKDDSVLSLAIALEAKETLNKTYTKDNFSVINVGQIKQIM